MQSLDKTSPAWAGRCHRRRGPAARSGSKGALMTTEIISGPVAGGLANHAADADLVVDAARSVS